MHESNKSAIYYIMPRTRQPGEERNLAEIDEDNRANANRSAKNQGAIRKDISDDAFEAARLAVGLYLYGSDVKKAAALAGIDWKSKTKAIQKALENEARTQWKEFISDPDLATKQLRKAAEALCSIYTFSRMGLVGARDLSSVSRNLAQVDTMKTEQGTSVEFPEITVIFGKNQNEIDSVADAEDAARRESSEE